MVPQLLDIALLGSPPRVRSRRRRLARKGRAGGITSACAEQTYQLEVQNTIRGDHLRVCGADGVYIVSMVSHPGSPPRVRSRRGVLGATKGDFGITSACAEQTHFRAVTSCGGSDHLRVCGADASYAVYEDMQSGSPPRVRSRPCLRSRRIASTGITSACAEQTSPVVG